MLHTKDPEQRTITNHVLSLIKIEDWTTEISHHGSFDTLVGIAAWMLRFGNNCRPGKQRETGSITPEQRAKALQRIVRQIQGISFQPTITQLQKTGCVAVNGCFCRLGEARQLFSGDSEKQWTTAVLTANVRFLLLC